jgi:transcriptional regulator with XRE-family HTH domain
MRPISTVTIAPAGLERKKALPRGTASKIARRLGCTTGHVSQVLHGKRRSPKVERAIARALRRTVAQAFPEFRHAA